MSDRQFQSQEDQDAYDSLSEAQKDEFKRDVEKLSQLSDDEKKTELAKLKVSNDRLELELDELRIKRDWERLELNNAKFNAWGRGCFNLSVSGYTVCWRNYLFYNI